ncbi:MAG: DUF5698 domain-containing protein [Cytophagales bacterium]|nr:DUF5698 domain-containing protein [Cytophagales bacterium]
MLALTQAEFTEWILVPFFIFFARVCDVSLDTIRIINVNQNNRWVADLLGFFQVMIWLLAVKQVMQNLNNFYYYFFYAGGFAAGNFIGLMIQEKLVKGIVLVRVISTQGLSLLADQLMMLDIQSTQMEGVAHDQIQKTYLMLAIVNRKRAQLVVDTIERTYPGAFYSVQDIRYASEDNLSKLGLFRLRDRKLASA